MELKNFDRNETASAITNVESLSNSESFKLIGGYRLIFITNYITAESGKDDPSWSLKQGIHESKNYSDILN